MSRAIALLLLVLGLGPAAADATVVFDRPAADPFTAGAFFADLSRPREAATSFELDQSAAVHGVAWRGSYFDPTTPGASTAFVISFFQDAAGMPAEAPFFTAEVLADVAALPGPIAEFSYAGVLPGALLLPGGVPLWISIAESDAATSASFTWRKSSESGTSFSRIDPTGAWQAFPGSAGLALDGLTTTVPEPGTAASLALGILGLAGVRRRESAR